MAMSDSEFTRMKAILKLVGGLVPEETIVAILKRAGFGKDPSSTPAMDRKRPCETVTTQADLARRYPHVARIGLS